MNEKEIFKYLAKREYNFRRQGIISPKGICFLCKKDNPTILNLRQCFPYDKNFSLLQVMRFYKKNILSFHYHANFRWYYIRKALILFGCNCTFHISLKKGIPLIIEPRHLKYCFIIAPIVHDHLITTETGEETWFGRTKEGYKTLTGCKCPKQVDKSHKIDGVITDLHSNKIAKLRQT